MDDNKPGPSSRPDEVDSEQKFESEIADMEDLAQMPIIKQADNRYLLPKIREILSRDKNDGVSTDDLDQCQEDLETLLCSNVNRASFLLAKLKPECKVPNTKDFTQIPVIKQADSRYLLRKYTEVLSRSRDIGMTIDDIDQCQEDLENLLCSNVKRTRFFSGHLSQSDQRDSNLEEIFFDKASLETKHSDEKLGYANVDMKMFLGQPSQSDQRDSILEEIAYDKISLKMKQSDEELGYANVDMTTFLGQPSQSDECVMSPEERAYYKTLKGKPLYDKAKYANLDMKKYLGQPLRRDSILEEIAHDKTSLKTKQSDEELGYANVDMTTFLGQPSQSDESVMSPEERAYYKTLKRKPLYDKAKYANLDMKKFLGRPVRRDSILDEITHYETSLESYHSREDSRYAYMNLKTLQELQCHISFLSDNIVEEIRVLWETSPEKRLIPDLEKTGLDTIVESTGGTSKQALSTPLINESNTKDLICSVESSGPTIQTCLDKRVLKEVNQEIISQKKHLAEDGVETKIKDIHCSEGKTSESGLSESTVECKENVVLSQEQILNQEILSNAEEPKEYLSRISTNNEKESITYKDEKCFDPNK